MNAKHQPQSKALKSEPARQTAVTETAQLAPKIWSARSRQVTSLNGLLVHKTTRPLRQTAVLRQQQQRGSAFVQRAARQLGGVGGGGGAWGSGVGTACGSIRVVNKKVSCIGEVFMARAKRGAKKEKAIIEGNRLAAHEKPGAVAGSLAEAAMPEQDREGRVDTAVLRPDTVLRLQRAQGNQFVQGLLAQRRRQEVRRPEESRVGAPVRLETTAITHNASLQVLRETLLNAAQETAAIRGSDGNESCPESRGDA
jgi:hypothetical protein